MADMIRLRMLLEKGDIGRAQKVCQLNPTDQELLIALS